MNLGKLLMVEVSLVRLVRSAHVTHRVPGDWNALEASPEACRNGVRMNPVRWWFGPARGLCATLLLVAIAIPWQSVHGQYTWTNVAGRTSGAGYQDATATEARLASPVGIVMAASGNACFCDSSNHVIRMITPGGVVSTFAGTSTRWEPPPVLAP